MSIIYLSIIYWFIYPSIIYLIIYLYLSIYSIALVAQLCPTLCDPVGYSLARLLCPWDFQGKNTGVHCCSLLWGIFLTQGSNQGLLHCRQILYCLSHWGSPIYEFTHLITYLSIHLSNHLSISTTIRPSSHLSIQLFIWPQVYIITSTIAYHLFPILPFVHVCKSLLPQWKTWSQLASRYLLLYSLPLLYPAVSEFPSQPQPSQPMAASWV